MTEAIHFEERPFSELIEIATESAHLRLVDLVDEAKAAEVTDEALWDAISFHALDMTDFPASAQELPHVRVILERLVEIEKTLDRVDAQTRDPQVTGQTPSPLIHLGDGVVVRVNEFEETVKAAMLRQRAADEAKRRLRLDLEVPAFDAGLLGEILSRPEEPPWRIESVLPSDAGLLVVGMRKRGKTTLLLNLANALINGGMFLGAFPVRRIEGQVGFLNFEVSAAQLARWADEHGVPHDRFLQVNLRGRRNPLDHPEDRAELASLLRSQRVETLVVDPFGVAYNGRSQNDSGEVRAWLEDLDRWARSEAGVSDLVLSAHAGWEGERSRGSSSLEDWADGILTIVADDANERYLKKTGRDVTELEDRLEFSQETRGLTLTGYGSRRETAVSRRSESLVGPVVSLVSAEPGLSGNQLHKRLQEAGVSPLQRGDAHKAAALAESRGLLRSESGPRNSTLFHPTPAATVPTIPDHPQGQTLTVPTVPYTGDGQQDSAEAGPSRDSQEESA